jgi:fructose-bisphosphate aldolase, class I
VVYRGPRLGASAGLSPHVSGVHAVLPWSIAGLLGSLAPPKLQARHAPGFWPLTPSSLFTLATPIQMVYRPRKLLPSPFAMMFAKPRINRLFAADGKCFDVAIDHGFFNEAAFLAGIENMHSAIQTVLSAGPDAVQLTVGQAPLLQGVPGKQKPALVLRTDVANVYGKTLPSYLFSRMIDEPVKQALRLDAACLCVNLFLLPDQPDVHAECIENICLLKPIADEYGMPLMVEPLVMQDNQKAGGYLVDGDIDKIRGLVRQAVELGADIIKADPCSDITEYHRVVEVAGAVPILVRGGGKASDTEILERTVELMRQGAKGIVYGRNVIQHEKPAAMTRALMSIVHEGADTKTALNILQG